MSEVDLAQQLHAQTARVPWSELQRHFARGVVIRVAPERDLVETAIAFVEDDRDRVAGWQAAGLIAPAGDSDARDWHTADAVLWAVVAAPWVLVQEQD